jgi:hypothetical protein
VSGSSDDCKPDSSSSSDNGGKSSENESDEGNIARTTKLGQLMVIEPEISTSRKAVYRDFSLVPTESQDSAFSMLDYQVASKEQTFPVKLHQILSDYRWGDIIAWLPHGRSWQILQQKRFEKEVIPFYFRHGRYSSFARQVNGWGFHRITHGSDYNSYYHEVSLTSALHALALLVCNFHIFWFVRVNSLYPIVSYVLCQHSFSCAECPTYMTACAA